MYFLIKTFLILLSHFTKGEVNTKSLICKHATCSNIQMYTKVADMQLVQIYKWPPHPCHAPLWEPVKVFVKLWPCLWS